jgi:hypothetical protein
VNFFTVEFSPDPLVSGQAINATVASTSGPSCFPPFSTVSRVDQTIVLNLVYSDFCQSGTPIPSMDYSIGSYPAGAYTFEINVCSDTPPPLTPVCGISFHGALVVGSSAAAGVSAISPLGECVLFVALMVVGIGCVRARRYYEHRMAA